MAQAQQIRSSILQNHESTLIVNQKFFKIKYIMRVNTVNTKYHETDNYHKNQGNSHMSSLATGPRFVRLSDVTA
jgi:hypothetical protein